MADTSIDAGASVTHSILDKYVKVGANAVVGEARGAEEGIGAAEGRAAGDENGAAGLEWLAGLSLVGKDTWIPEGGRVRRPSAIGVGGRYEDFRDGVLDAGTVVPNRRWYEELR